MGNQPLQSIAVLTKRVTLALIVFVLSYPLWGMDITAVERGESGNIYAATEEEGLFFSPDGGYTWWKRSEGLPKKIVWPFERAHYRFITDISVDPAHKKRIALTTSTGLFISKNEGRSWREKELRFPVKPSNYITAVSFDPGSENRVYLGSSFNGLFVSEDRGASWKKLGELLDPLYRGAGFYKEISDIVVVRGHGIVYLLNEFDKKIYLFTLNKGIRGSIDIPQDVTECSGITPYYGGGVENAGIEVHGLNKRYIYDIEKEVWKSLPALFLEEEDGGAKEPKELFVQGRERGSGKKAVYAEKRAIYLRAYNAYGPRLEKHLEFIKRHGFNAIVVDVKDDWGKLTYKTELEQHRSYGATRDLFDIRDLIDRAHKEGLYVIGRMVVFKDRVLYRVNGHEYAVWDEKQKEPWRHRVVQENSETGKSEYVQREHWVDPFSEDVWDYNIAIAEELESYGLDEIQFDYIRFPSDGMVDEITYRHRKENMKKTEAIESYLAKADKALSIPISTDLYGFNSWYRMGNWIGQDMEMLSHYADVICPMFYPSHFDHSFLSEYEYIDRAHRLYKEGTRRASTITDGRSVIRPYVQAFLMGAELSMEEEEYERYLNRQIEGSYKGGGSGYTLWNNMNRYYMVNSRVSILNAGKETETDT